MKKYFLIQNKDDYADLLSVGFGFECVDPWGRFDVMYDRYKENSCVDISYSSRFIIFGNLEHFLSASYTPGTLDDVVAMVKQTQKLDK